MTKNPQDAFQMALLLTLAASAAVLSIFVMPSVMESIDRNQTTAEDNDIQDLMWWSRLPSLEEILATLIMGGDIQKLFETKSRKRDALGSTKKRKSPAIKKKRGPRR